MGNSYTHDNRIAPNVVQVHTFYGSPDTATMRPNSHGENIAPATWSTAPYKPPPRREKDNPDRALCGFEGCKAFPSQKAGGTYCAGHARKLGVIPTCLREECCGARYKGTQYCYHHQPKMAVSEATDGDAG